MIAPAFVFRLALCDTALCGERSLVCGARSFRIGEADAKGRGTMELSGVALATVHLAQVAFATLGDAFSELAVLETFAVLAVL